MTTEHIHDQVATWINEAADGTRLSPYAYYTTSELHRDIDRVIDIINSRNCNNCQFDTSSPLCGCGIVRPDGRDHPNFACNLWQPIN